ncbi:hypothetical protein B0H14DRAFT_2730764, partial [Mycena olivaceomarginata]
EVPDVYEPMVVEEYGVVRRGGGEGDEVAEGRKCPVKRVQAPRVASGTLRPPSSLPQPVLFSIFLAYPHATRDGRRKRQAGRTYGHYPHPGPALATTHKYTSRAATWYPSRATSPSSCLPVHDERRRASTETRADRHKHKSEGNDKKGMVRWAGS